jgi:hypothetical protein
LTTAATDLVLAALCAGIVFWLRGLGPSWALEVWRWLFALIGVAASLGAVAHGCALGEWTRKALWQPLYLSLGLAVALFVVAAVAAWRGEPEARGLLPWALAAGAAFYGLTVVLRGAFIVFIAYEALAMLAALAIYLWLAMHGVSGSWWLVAGVGLSLVAAGIQASSLRIHCVVPFDRNGLFHLVQIVAMVLLAVGVRLSFGG